MMKQKFLNDVWKKAKSIFKNYTSLDYTQIYINRQLIFQRWNTKKL